MNNIHGGDIYRNSIKLDFSVNINPLLLPENIKKSLYDAIGRCGQYPDYNHEILKKGLAIVHDIFTDNSMAISTVPVLLGQSLFIISLVRIMIFS